MRANGRARRAALVVTASAAMAASMLASTATAHGASAQAGSPAQPAAADGTPVTPVAMTPLDTTASYMRPYTAPAAPSWPAAGTADVPLQPAARQQAGTLPVSLSLIGTPAPAAPAPSAGPGVRVRVESLPQQRVQALGGDGMAFLIGRTDAATSARVAVTMDYAGYAHAFGGNFADRLGLARLPGCALTTPQDPGCTQPVFLPSVNDVAAGTLTADLDALPQPANGWDPQTPVYVIESTAAGGSTGTYKATDLKPSGSWSEDGASGGFGYDYPLPMPAPPAGSAPSLALEYDSQSVDGRTSATNNQASWAGMGWELSPPYIEREYTDCGEVGHPQLQDLCWKSPSKDLTSAEYVISLDGQTTELIRDSAASDSWTARDDQGWKITLKTGGPNGDKYGQWWLVTTPDGTQYRFGYHTDSNWTVPVVAPKNGEPCYNSGLKTCTRTWRWNLDQSQDTNANIASYTYTTETNKYRSLADNADVSYDSGGYLDQVTYGGHAGQQPADMITFHTVGRCTEATHESEPDVHPPADCPAMDQAHATSWPDVPIDLICHSTCTKNAPAFFITHRLNYISTSVRDEAGGWQPVTRIQAKMMFPWQPGQEDPAPWLEWVRQTGEYHGSEHLPVTRFSGTPLRNRVDYSDTKQQLNFYRLTYIGGNLGTQTTITYGHGSAAAACPDGGENAPGFKEWLAKKQWDHSDQECYRQYYSPGPGQPGQWGIFTKYVITQVVTRDALDLPGEQDQVTSYGYQGAPAWRFAEDPITPDQYLSWSQWRGYGTVQVTTGGDDGPHTITGTTYFRGMDGDRLAGGGVRHVTVTDFAGHTYDDDDYLQDLPLQVRHWQQDPDGPMTDLSSERYTYWHQETAPGDGSYAAYMVRPAGDWTSARELSGTYRTTWTQTDGYTPANSGLPTRTIDFGDGTDPVCTTTAYAQNPGLWLMDYPETVITYAGGTGPDGTCDGYPVAKTITLYDGNQTPGLSQPVHGNVTEVRTYTDPIHYSFTRASYDGYGRVTQATDPLGGTTTTSYDPGTGIPYKGVTVTNPLGQKTATVPDPASGAPWKVTDPNKYTTITSYDPLGRITSVSQPLTDPDKPGTPAWTFSYTLHFSGVGRITAPTEAATRQLMSDTGGNPRWLDSYAYLDGYGRTVQTQTPSPGGGRMINATWYNSRGLTSAATSQPYHDGKDAGSGLDTVDYGNVKSLTRTSYDALQRPVTVALYSQGKFKWETRTRYAADVTIVTPPSGGATATWTDGHGRTSKIQQNYPIRRGSPPLDMATTRYTWNARGDLATITGPAGSVTTYTYDWAGNKIAASDPDTGITTYIYNPAGQPTSTTDANGTTISTTYDALGRQTSQWDGQPGTGTELAAWSYDKTPGGIGQLTGSDTYQDGHQYATDLITSYDKQYNATGEKITITGAPVPALNQAYDYGYGYDLAGHQTSISYPAAGGLPGETVHTGYSNQGLPDNLTSTLDTGFTYIPAVTYDDTAMLASRSYGEDSSVRRIYSWDDATGQITNVATSVHGDANPVQDDTYTWDPSGNLRSDHSNDPGSAGQYQCYGYDNFPRLTTAWTTTASSGCGSGIRGADALGGTPYKQTWAYDIAGNMTASTSGSQATTYTYPAPTAPQPHALVTAGSGSYRYDADGQMIRRTIAGQREYLDWTPQGQLAQLTSPAGDSSFVYDTTGTRLTRTTPQGSTLYLPGTELTADTHGTITGTRYYTIGGATVAVRTTPTAHDPDGPLTWIMADSQGSAQLTIPASDTSTAAIQRYLPYGTIRGQRAITVTDRGYLSQPLDSTGLIADGARYYDPTTGHFISPDPVVTPTSPDTLNAYAYADDNPATYTDPSGLEICDGMGACGSLQSFQQGGSNYSPAVAGSSFRPQYTVAYEDAEYEGSTSQEQDVLNYYAENYDIRTWQPLPTPAAAPRQGFFDQIGHSIESGWDTYAEGQAQLGNDVFTAAGQVTGIDAAISCINSGNAATCAKAAAELTLTAAAIASFGGTADVEVAVEASMDAAEEGATTAGSEVTTWYPPNDGFLGEPTSNTLEPGTQIDRYGGEGGRFVSPKGTPEAMRALAPGATTRPYNIYQVVNPIEVRGGTIAPWFGQLGLGTQYVLPDSVGNLLEGGYLKLVEDGL